MSESLPIGWKMEPLRNLSQVVSGGTPSRYEPKFWRNGEIPWVTPSDITKTAGRFLENAQEKISEIGLRSCSARRLPSGALLMTSRATLGEIRISTREVSTNQGFKSLVPLNGVDGLFLYYQVSQNKERYKALGIGSTFLEVGKRDTENFEILLPPLLQQRRIAEILGAVDEAVEQTEALIAKQQQIKAGLMHDLFTRGLTSDGHLRPPQSEAPDLYQDSPLGWIPKEWEAELLENVEVRGSGHTPNRHHPEYWNGGVKWISLADSSSLDRIYISDTEHEISELGIANSSATMHPPGIVVLSRDAGVGKSAIPPAKWRSVSTSCVGAVALVLIRTTSTIGSNFERESLRILRPVARFLRLACASLNTTALAFRRMSKNNQESGQCCCNRIPRSLLKKPTSPNSAN